VATLGSVITTTKTTIGLRLLGTVIFVQAFLHSSEVLTFNSNHELVDERVVPRCMIQNPFPTQSGHVAPRKVAVVLPLLLGPPQLVNGEGLCELEIA
jgi:hypothetical protein